MEIGGTGSAPPWGSLFFTVIPYFRDLFPYLVKVMNLARCTMISFTAWHQLTSQIQSHIFEITHGMK